MSRQCAITKVKPSAGNHVSHARNHVKRRFYPNLQRKRFWDEEKNCFVKLRVTAKGIRMIDKLGLKAALSRSKNLEIREG